MIDARFQSRQIAAYGVKLDVIQRSRAGGCAERNDAIIMVAYMPGDAG